MGVAILSPSSITLKSSRRGDDTCFWTSVDINISLDKKLRVVSVYAPPGAKNSNIRKEINLAIDPIIKDSELMTVIAGDFNDVINPELDSSQQNFRSPAHSTLKYIIRNTSMMEP